jgi:hypothetical protein
LAVYFGQFSDRVGVAFEFIDSYDRAAFVPPEGFPADDDILFASYGGGRYDGDAFVLFMRDGHLFEVSGSHCSCFGLEGQWGPEATTWEALAMRSRKSDDDYYYHLSDHEDDAVKAFWLLVDSHRAVVT